MNEIDLEYYIKRYETDVKNMKKIVEYLKFDLEARKDACGEEDDLIVAPAKKAYKRAKRIYKHMKGE